MIHHNRISPRRLTVLLALLFGAAAVQPGFAATQPPDPVTLPTSSVAVTLIKRLSEKGILGKNDSAELLLLAEAEEAENRAQAAMLQAALAQAAAAQARLKAVMAMASRPRPESEPVAVADTTEETESLPAPRVVHHAAPARPRVAPVDKVEAASDPAPTEADPVAAEPVPETAPIAPRVGATSAQLQTAPTQVEIASASASADAPAEEEKVPEDTVRVTYVPEVVKAQLRAEVKQDVLDEARREGWATPQAVPDWISRFRLFGDIRFRSEGIHYGPAMAANGVIVDPNGNDNTGAFPNFNAINTGAPFDTSGALFSPQYNVDQTRNRLRLRARAGAAIDLGQNFTAGLRLATGENNSPVTQNQSMGAAGSGQGGNFSKYAVWLDRAFLKYETGGLPDQDFAVSFGRFDNPFMSTSMVWADDLGFDGAVAQGRFSLGEDVTPFFALGAFPVFNTDLNFASNQPAKFKSTDKWLYGGQLGTTFELSKDFSLKLGAAGYLFQNIEGKLSSAMTPTSSADVGNTDSTRPAFAQKGNTYMPLRDITPGPLNANGTTNQWQYFGLASKFHELSLDGRLDFNRFEPVQISLVAEYIKNAAFDRTAIDLIAVNNRDAIVDPVTKKVTSEPFVGSNTAWLVGLSVGDVALKKRWDWNANLNYRKVGSDSVVDGFNDSDFGGGGTNVKGFTLGGNVALSPSVWIGLRWFSASEVAGPTFKNDIFQLDLNGKF